MVYGSKIHLKACFQTTQKPADYRQNYQLASFPKAERSMMRAPMQCQMGPRLKTFHYEEN